MAALSCPKCQRLAVRGGRGCLVWFFVILLFPIGLVLLRLRPAYRCTHCGYRFFV
jgi:hypothetical protein